MGRKMGARWGGRLALALLIMGWAVTAAPARADEPAKELTEEERGKLEKEAGELNAKAVRMYNDGQFVAATELFQKVLAFQRTLYPAGKYDGHPDLAASLTNMGLALQARGDYGSAEGYFRKALEMRKRIYPANIYPDGNSYLAQSLNDLGHLLKQRGAFGQAEPCYREALEMRWRLYPPEKYPDGHPDLAASLNNLGALLQDRGEYGKAELYYRDALEMYQRLYAPENYPNGHPDLAASLNNMGFLLQARGDYGQAEPYYREALAMKKRLYPPENYPNGHPDLALSLNNLGALLLERGEYGKAEPYYRDALQMYQHLYSPERYPDGHPDLARSLNNLGELLRERGEYGKAEPYYRDALAMCKLLYSPERYPDGHPDLARSLNNLGELLRERGEYGQAEPYDRHALEMYQRLYSPERYPHGHPGLARSLNNLGVLLDDRGEYGQAERYYRDALAMCKLLYSPERYTEGHPDLARSFSNLGALLEERGEYGQAERYYREALDMRKRLYPPEKYSEGHPDLALSLNNLGELQRQRGEYGKAEPLLRDALDMRKRLYPADKYPDGHPNLASSLNNLGALLVERGEYGKAHDILVPGAAMYDRLAASFAETGAEAEALNLAASLPLTHNGFLAASTHADGTDPARDYTVLWPGKAAIARVLERRRHLLRAAAAADERTRGKLGELLATREDLARLILAPARPGDADREQLLKDLTDRKERLEKELAAVLPPATRETPPCTELADRLPDHAAFVDLYWYRDWDSKTKKWDDGRYAAFVLRKGRPVRRVELDDGAAIDKDLAQWRQDIDKGFASDAAGRLRTSVWEPIVKALGDGVDTVYVCPDGNLVALPWPALPGDRDGRVLLEYYTFATVPSGLLLLQQLPRPTPADRDAGVLLAVGGVRYDRAGTPADKADKPWPALPATEKERAAVAAQARKMAKAPEVIDPAGTDANVAELLKDLPRARWAHLATHGFFAAPESKEREHLFRPGDFLQGVGMERRGAAARNPLTLSGLVLAGANQPTDADPGLLTGEAIAGLNLDGMNLAVLSACKTGLGEQSTGEGVFGLQRAFHIAGAKNVIASLWTVDDDATAALMNLFYYHLWEKNEPALEALHHAQLELYRNPQGIPALARGRGAPDWDDAVQVMTKPPADPKAAPRRAAAVRDWAAFVLSGAGR